MHSPMQFFESALWSSSSQHQLIVSYSASSRTRLCAVGSLQLKRLQVQKSKKTSGVYQRAAVNISVQ